MKKLLKNKLVIILAIFLVSSGVVLASKASRLSSSNSLESPNEMSEKLALGDVPPGSVRGATNNSNRSGSGANSEGSVLGEHTEDNPLFFTVNVPARFKQDISAPNVVYSVNGDSGEIEINNSLVAGDGIGISGRKISNTGILTLVAGTGVSIDGNKITNSGILELVAGDNISIDGNTITNDYSVDLTQSGWTDNGSTITLTTTTDTVTLDTLTFGNATITNGKSFTPDTDLGSDLGSSALRFNNLWVANINSNSSQAFSGQTTFSYPPTDTTITEASVIINPTTSVANGQLLGLGIAGYQRALIDEDGDMILGYSNATSAPANDYPLSIYGHSGTNVSFINETGGAYFAGNVGIGTSSPSQKLEISQSTYGIDLNPLKIYDGAYTYYIGGRKDSLAANEVSLTKLSGNTYFSHYSGKMYFSTSGAKTMEVVIDESGNVGIGTTTPISKLHLSGAVTGKALAIFDELGDQDIFTASASGVPKFVIDNSGNVGIGTGSPGVKLEVNGDQYFTSNSDKIAWRDGGGTAHTFIQSGNYVLNFGIYSGTTTLQLDSKGRFKIGGTNPVGKLDLSGAVTGKALAIFDELGDQDIFTASASGVPKFVIDNSGNVGIGTSSPTRKLNVAGVSRFEGNISLDSTTESNRAILFTSTNLSSYASGAIKGSLLSFYNSDTEVVRITSGLVGISTTTPTSKLDITTLALGTTQTTSSGLALVNTTAAASGAQQISPAIRWSGLGWKTDATAASQAVDFRSFVVPVEGIANPSGYLTFQSSINGGSYTDGMVITSGGNVGIGTSSPGAKLEVSGNILLSGSNARISTPASTGLTIDPGYASKIAMTNGIELTTDANGVYPDTDNVRPFGLSSRRWKNILIGTGDSSFAGQVGIGDTTPSYSLDVTGMMRATEGIATYTKAGTISDTDFTETAIDGQMAVDSTNGRIYFRHSGGWHYVAQTAGFQIPEYETFSFSFEENKFDTSKPLADGDFLIPFVDKHLEDGAIHGLYTKFSDVKGLLFEDETTRIEDLEATVEALAIAVPDDSGNEMLTEAIAEQGSLIENIKESFILITDNVSKIMTDISNLTNRILALEDKTQNGQLTIPVETNSAKITFSQEFSNIPQIYLTSNSVLPSYTLSEISKASFTIVLDQVASEDLVISWMATTTADDQSTIEILDNSINLPTPTPVVPEETTLPVVSPIPTLEPETNQEATQSGQI